jgi:hypothetical protein
MRRNAISNKRRVFRAGQPDLSLHLAIRDGVGLLLPKITTKTSLSLNPLTVVPHRFLPLYKDNGR